MATHSKKEISIDLFNLPLIGWILRYPAYAVGLWGIIYYMQVHVQIGVAWLCELWYRILLIGCLCLSLGCDTWFTISYANA